MDHNGVNPFRNWAKVVDCGDIFNTPFDKLVAIQELESGMKALNQQTPKNTSAADAVRLISIGGDHTISEFCISSNWSRFSNFPSSTNSSGAALHLGMCGSSPFR